jgi:transposase, IS30 family
MAHHLTHKEREIVAQRHHDRRKQWEIAERLERDPSTISRELRRNGSSRGYSALAAQLKVYFADAYCAWQRGTNENTNGLIRQFFPKGTDLARIPEHRFTTVQQLLNDRPRKRLGYRTPSELLSSRLLAFQT